MSSSKLNEPIAVIGSACRFAGDADSPSKLWELLQNPGDLRQEIPDSRFNADAWYHPDGSYHGHSNVKHAYLLNEDVGVFDAEFFGIKPVEAKAMDPQQRMLMETAYEGLESAGITMADLKGSDTAVYVGVMFQDYTTMLLRDLQEVPTYFATGTGNSILSNRISYFFDLHGPSVTVDTACSSSLVAVHMAVQALRNGDSRIALACGSNLILDPSSFIIESKMKMLSPDGRSRMWDASANGYARGEGIATVVLKTLSAALEDGDHIECIIRETGLNQDGATGGITMPSPTAQEALIRSTYAKAGLDLLAQSDRPQYFEAHGTGTPAGDPVEAEAIYRAFNAYPDQIKGPKIEDPLYVGSIKTILGHTEGTAGVAAILKTSLALQHGSIPPNRLLEKLNDRVAPFYKNVKILDAATAWPSALGGTRRASVNSFGFGGCNAHAILENYANHSREEALLGSDSVGVFSPFVFSAHSEQSLRANLRAFANYLETSQADPRDLAWTLRSRRSTFPYRISFIASSLSQLKEQIIAKLEDESTPIGTRALPASRKTAPQILGVFTGQGAQYARMGAELIEKSDKAQKIIQQLEADLAQLPDGPDWSLMSEILAEASSSRINEARFSQATCTAIQILLVDMLRSAGVEFDAVVGHSSGEIAAAYAAGYLTARDAICVAYYRGLHVDKAASPNGTEIRGAMLAVGASLEDVLELCDDEVLRGRIGVAASNSPSSITVSGDEDAIAELQTILDDEKKFNRRLKVDKAYHSKHMIPCYEPYVASLKQCGVAVQKPTSRCTWYSSVFNKPAGSDMNLADTYWADNMTKPVLFTEALTSALNAGSFDLALEVGAHPALKGPATQTIDHVLQKSIPYEGILARSQNAIVSSATGLGFLWSYLDKASINLDSYEKAMGNEDCFYVVKDLPKYQWNHQTRYWHESRASRKMLHRRHQVHGLLGDVTSDSAPHHMSWRNLLRESEMEWVAGHRVQGQTVFPAAGYLTVALEAARVIAENKDQDIRLIDIKDFVIHQAVPFSSDDAGIEALTSMAEIMEQGDLIHAKYTYSAALDANAEDLTLIASANIEIRLGEPSESLLPTRKPALPHVVDVEPDRFYAALADLGYNFSGRFRSLSALRRKYYKASCQIRVEPIEEGADKLLIHPAELDATLQGIILAYSYPYDEELRTLHLPTSIQHIRINPALLGATGRTQSEQYDLDSFIVPRKPGQRGISGHVDLYSNKSSSAAIQIQGAEFMPLGGAAAEEDRRLFSSLQWVNDKPDGEQAHVELPENFRDTVLLLERIATYYLRQFHHDVPAGHPARSEFTTKWYLNFARHIIESGHHKWAQKEWVNDKLEDIMAVSKPFMHLPDVEIMHLIGRSMPRVFNEETTILEELRATDVLDRYYAGGFGLGESARWVGRTVKQITDRYPHMNVLEIGAGTGGATKHIFSEIGQSFQSYTYTDLSAAFFQNAANIFSEHRDRMVFKTLDAEKDPLEQGFTEGTYDLIVAFFIIHAVSDVRKALRHLRKLLRPGGYLVVGEGQHSDTATVATSGFIFGTLQGWWYGAPEGRELSPYVSPQEWNQLLIETGFSGFDAHPPESFEDTLSVCHFASQAVDEEVKFYREPLVSTWRAPAMKKLVLVGGQTDRSANLVEGLKSLLKRDAVETYTYKSLVDIDYDVVDVESTVVSFTELDHPVFKDITPDVFTAFKKMFEHGKTLLWVTSGRRDDEPFSNMTVGWGRVAVHETPDLRLQQLDIADPQTASCESIAEIVLRHHASASKSDKLIWSLEPEIVLDSNGRRTIPRLRPIQSINDRYMSTRRTIVQDKDASTINIAVQPKPDGWMIKEQSRYEAAATETRDQQELTELSISRVILSALPTPLGHKYLVLGESSGVAYLALVSKLASVLRVPTCSVVSVEGVEASLLKTAAQLIASAILQSLHAGQTLAAHNIPNVIVDALNAQASSKNVRVVYMTDSSDRDVPASWVKLPQYLTRRDLVDVLSTKPAAFVGLSVKGAQTSENEATIISILPPSCHIMTANNLFASETAEDDNNSAIARLLGDSLRAASIYAQNEQPITSDTISLDELAAGKRFENPLSIIDWKAAKTLPIHAARVDSSPMFKGVDSTYWILGMSGALGISMCDWMISAGARNIVVTSRNPDISPEWIAAHKRKGATVAVHSCDATNEAALRAVHQKIVETLPPIVGVMNGAMVLRDTLIRKMTFNELTDVVGPKVLGSIHLDRIFHNVDLDFFVLVASINCVIGNVGQANYGAANTFMNALTAQRRKRGLRAATVNGGAIVGAGYMQRESRRQLDLIVRKLHMMRMSEEDWNQSICEAIDASRLDSITDGYVTAGISDVSIDTTDGPYWLSNPMLSAFVLANKPTHLENKNGDGKTTASVQSLLADCETEQDVKKVIEKAFATQLRSVLQRDMPDADLMAACSTDIGLDSLVSVDIRSWFLKSLQVSIPVLKIMGNDTMATIVQYAAENVPPELLPKMAIVDTTADSSESGDVTDSSSNSGSGMALETPASEWAGPGEGGILASRTTSGKIDWEAEARPSPELAKFTEAVGPAPVSPPNVIVLTGATGLLGHHLLDYLLERTSARKIVCLGIRNLASRKQNNELLDNPRVEYHEGALADHLLGLTEEQATEIFSQADVVIHNGADTSHLKYFADLKASNVGSTKALASLCLPRRIPMHYVSSAGLAVLYNGPAFPPTRVTGRENSYPAEDGTFGYMCSKWTNERFLEQVHDLYGLPVAIHRPSTIMREGEDAEGQRAQLDWVNALLQWSEIIGAAPRVEHNRGALDLVRISSACESILSHVLDDSERARTKVTYAHQTSDLVLPLNRLKNISVELGKGDMELDVLPMKQWIAKSVEAGLHPAIAALIEIMDVPGAPDYPRILRGSSKVVEM